MVKVRSRSYPPTRHTVRQFSSKMPRNDRSLKDGVVARVPISRDRETSEHAHTLLERQLIDFNFPSAFMIENGWYSSRTRQHDTSLRTRQIFWKPNCQQNPLDNTNVTPLYVASD